MEQLSMNVSAQRTVIEAEIVTLQPEVAATLERLRYLVFQGQKGRDGADGKNYGIVVDGSVDEVLKLKSVEVPGAGAFGWQPISSEDLILEADLNVRSVEAVSAFYCAALGLVRIAVRAVADASDTLQIRFSENSGYKPYVIPCGEGVGHCLAVLTGESAACFLGCAVAYLQGWGGALIQCSGEEIFPGDEFFITGFYYTEDISAGGAG